MMKMLVLELKKEKQTGIIPLLLSVGILGAAYALANFWFRKDSLWGLPLAPMDILLTQLYGVLMILNMFGSVVAACMIYHMEFEGNAVKKLYMLPVSLAGMYLSKFMILTIMLFWAIVLQNLALMAIGMTNLPSGAFDLKVLVDFTMYAFLTSMPVLAFELLVASRSENIGIPLGVGVIGFLSGMAVGTSKNGLFLIDPFVVMLKPAVSMSAQPDGTISIIALIETLLFLGAGLWLAKNRRYE